MNRYPKELPIGLAMSLSLNEFAMEYYSSLDSKAREKITKYIQGGATGEDTKMRINKAIDELEHNSLEFLN